MVRKEERYIHLLTLHTIYCCKGPTRTVMAELTSIKAHMVRKRNTYTFQPYTQPTVAKVP